MMNILAWIILGVVAGAIAKALYPGRQGGGFLGTMILGIIGSFVGGILHTLITTGELALASGIYFWWLYHCHHWCNYYAVRLLQGHTKSSVGFSCVFPTIRERG